MVATNWLKRAVVVAGLLAISTTGAQALTLNVTGGGLEAGNQNYGCPTAPGTCSLAAHDYLLTAPAIALGTITINDDGTEIDIALTLSPAGASFTGSGGLINFGPATYLAHLSGPSVITGPNSIDSGFGTGTINGTVNAGALAVAAANVSISCDFPGGTGQCGISFGESGFTNVLGNDWRHTFNVTVELPEPTTALLVALGLAALALRARAR